MAWKLTHAHDVARQIAISHQQSLNDNQEARGVELAVWCINDNGERNPRNLECALTVHGGKQLTARHSAKNAQNDLQNRFQNITEEQKKRHSRHMAELNALVAVMSILNFSHSTIWTELEHNIEKNLGTVTEIVVAAAGAFTAGLRKTIIQKVSACSVGIAILLVALMATARMTGSA